MDYAVLLSAAGAAIWLALYRLDKRSRIRRAAKDGTPPELIPALLFRIISGISGQLLYWLMIAFLKEWGGSDR